MRRFWDVANTLIGYTVGWSAAYAIGMGTFLRALCGFAGAMAWLGIAEVITLHLRRRKATEDPRDARIRDLEAENAGITAAAQTLHDSYKQEHERQALRIERLRAEKVEVLNQCDGLNDIVRGLNKALALKQAELDKALAECKRLHQLISKLDVDNLQLAAALETAREEIAGLKLGVAS